MDSNRTSVPRPIDRRALVSRHDIRRCMTDRRIALGNGEFCFGADPTGLQTFGGNTMAHWAWHSFPLPEEWRGIEFPETGCFLHGRLPADGRDTVPPEVGEAWRYWMDNPHAFSLGRLRLCGKEGRPVAADEIELESSVYRLWDGISETAFRRCGRRVRVKTCVHPELDAVSVRLEGEGPLTLALDFPYPTFRNDVWTADFEAEDRHGTVFSLSPRAARADRSLDGTAYVAELVWTEGEARQSGKHTLLLCAGDRTELTLRYGPAALGAPLPGFAETARAAAAFWNGFWRSGGALDLSESRDPRWFELERRIVVSQYFLRAQSAGSWPSSESGLMDVDPWRGRFHMEMLWWHAAHCFFWGRPEMAERQLGCYRAFLPRAERLARQLGTRGAVWGKSLTPEGRSAPWDGNLALLWRQPHPIFFAELEYRLRPTAETLEKWAGIVEATAENMADTAVPGEDGRYHLDPVMPPSELGFTRDTVFDLAYWRWALGAAAN
ncbi:MAG: hypothetical protein IJL69_00325 [Oscillospiraceae bacterium]|nr:hypothetical protein [Oscillospiraceae bacterium]